MDEFNFEAALAAKVAPQEGTTIEEEAVAVGETEVALGETGATPDGPELVSDDGNTDEDDRLFAGKFRDEGELEKAYLSLQQLQGRQSGELGDLRRTVDQLSQHIESAQQSPQYMPDFDEFISEQPQQAAIWALQNQREDLFDRALESWYEDNPREAGQFETDMKVARMRYEMEQQFGPRLEPLQQQHSQRLLNQQHSALVSKYPDFDETLGSASEAEVNEIPGVVADLLSSDDPVLKAQGLESAYRWVKAGRANAASSRLDAQQEGIRAQKRTASVASASSSGARGEKSAIEQLKEQMLAPDAFSVQHGLSR